MGNVLWSGCKSCWPSWCGLLLYVDLVAGISNVTGGTSCIPLGDTFPHLASRHLQSPCDHTIPFHAKIEPSGYPQCLSTRVDIAHCPLPAVRVLYCLILTTIFFLSEMKPHSVGCTTLSQVFPKQTQLICTLWLCVLLCFAWLSRRPGTRCSTRYDSAACI